MAELHKAIKANDPKVEESFTIDDKQSTVTYKQDGEFKYALSSRKSHISLHVMPMYINTDIHDRYQVLLPKAKFMKGCINFKKLEQVPPDITADLIRDSSKVAFPPERK